MDWQVFLVFIKRGIEAVLTSLVSTIIFTTTISLFNSTKVSKRTKKIKPLFEKTKKYFKELCDGSFVVTPKCVKSFYTISKNCKGGYKSLLSDLCSQRGQIIKLSKYSFVSGKCMDKMLDAISIYDSIISKLSIVSQTGFDGVHVTFNEETYRDDASKDFERLDNFFQVKSPTKPRTF